MGHSVKVHFRLVQDEDGYPPVAVESLWAEPATNADEYVLDNIPFFARDATIGDTILVREEEGHRWFERLVHSSSNSLVRAVFFDQAGVERVTKRLIALGCSTEYMNEYKLLAVSVPADANLADAQSYLQVEASAGSIDYEEAILRQ
jgi:hypothetical protein